VTVKTIDDEIGASNSDSHLDNSTETKLHAEAIPDDDNLPPQAELQNAILFQLQSRGME